MKKLMLLAAVIASALFAASSAKAQVNVSINPQNGIYTDANAGQMTFKVDDASSTQAVIYVLPPSVTDLNKYIFAFPAGSTINGVATSLSGFTSSSGLTMVPPYSSSNISYSPYFNSNKALLNSYIWQAPDGNYYLKAVNNYNVILASVANGKTTTKTGTMTVKWDATNGGGNGGGNSGGGSLPGSGGGNNGGNGGGNGGGGNNGGGNDTLPGTGSNNTGNGTASLIGNGTVSINPPNGIFTDQNGNQVNLKADPNATDSAAYVAKSDGTYCLMYPNGSSMNGQTVNLKNGITTGIPFSYTASNVFPGTSATNCGTLGSDGKYYLNPGSYNLAVASIVNGNLVWNTVPFTVAYNATGNGGGSDVLPGTGNGGGDTLPGTDGNGNTNQDSNQNNNNTVTSGTKVSINPQANPPIYVDQNNSQVFAQAALNSTASAVYVTQQGTNKICAVFPDGSSMNGQTLNLKNGIVTNTPYSYPAGNVFPGSNCATQGSDGKYYLNPGNYNLVVASIVNGKLTQKAGPFTVAWDAKNTNTGIENTNASNKQVYMSNGVMYVKSCQGTTCSVYTTDGRKVYGKAINNVEEQINNLPKGILIYKGSDGTTSKVINQ
ncbi:MAG: hypothetical protein FWF35_01160 [Elusimicrobia bacterium]|nr:hypothetical protein [Elusimicrobiota bacterium]